MNKDLLTALVLSLIFIFTYSTFFLSPPSTQKKTKETPKVETQSDQKKEQVLTDKVNTVEKKPVESDIEKKIITVETPNYILKIDTENAHISSLLLKKYNFDKPFETPYYSRVFNFITGSDPKKPTFYPGRKVEMVGDYIKDKSEPTRFFLSNTDSDVIFQSDIDTLKVIEKDQKIELIGTTVNGLQIRKTYTFSAHNYIINVDVEIENHSNQDTNIKPIFRVGAGNEHTQKVHNETPKEGVAIFGNELDTFDNLDEGEQAIEGFSWSGVMDFHFITAVKAVEKWTGLFSPIESDYEKRKVFVPNFDLIRSEAIKLNSGQSWSQSFSVYFGPKKYAEMEKFEPTFIESLDLVFSIIGHPMLFGLRYFHQFVNNWGLAIICLTIAVRIIIFPLALIGMKSMKRMQQLGPKIKTIREQHSKNKERMNAEVMKLYKKNKINPVGGCLPLLLQIPIFIALYWALLPAIELRQQPFFFWIQNLAAPDHTMLLPVLMGVTMYFQQKITPMSASMDPMQKKLFQFFPIMMTFFFITFPSGLVLYWLTSNILTILQQFIFNKVKIKDIVD